MSQPAFDEYHYGDAAAAHTSEYLWSNVLQLLQRWVPPDDRRVFELGCGNGAFAARMTAKGFTVTAVDPSTAGIEIARREYPGIRFESGSAYNSLGEGFGTFPVVVSLEVIEHVYAPRVFARCIYDLLEPGGVAILTTPYHGYVQNLAMAITGRLDGHFTALWDHGHIKFWSIKTLSNLLTEIGFLGVEFVRVGRVPLLAKSMIATCRRPLAGIVPSP